jgi:two-component system, cell cycle sensor histidine kinase and response regulator CckA
MSVPATATVLHVDDDAANRRSLGWVLKAEGFSVVEAGTGADALQLVVRQKPDLVILDVRLPDMSGFEVCRQIKADPSTSSIPVLQLSGHFVEPKDRVQGLETGADAYLMKPVDPQELIAHMHALLRVHRAEQMLRAILATSPDAVLVLDAGGAIRQGNPVTERLFGYLPRDLIGRPVTELLPQSKPLGDSGLAVLLDRAGGRLTLLVEGRRADRSTFPAEVTVGAMRLEPEWLFAVFVRDLTERNRLEEQLRQAVKMEAIGRLAGGVAHDFNNQLTVINGYTDLLLSSLPPEDTSREFLSEIRRSGEHAATLTRHLLAFSRKQRLQPQVLNLNTVLGEVSKLLRRLLGADIHLAIDLDPDLGAVRADPNQLEQVLVNLAVNARDAMQHGGRLEIRTRNLPPVDAGERNPEMPLGPRVLLEVRDTGAGMNEAVRSHVFEPFFTTKGPGKGTGLGLATVYGIVKQSGGHIDVQSAPGAGAMFRVYLPGVETAAVFGLTPAETIEVPRGNDTILLAEDEVAVRGLASIILRSCGYRVLEASDGPEALRLARECAGPLHLLITDVMMPRMNGVQLATQVRVFRPDIRVLFISGYTDDVVVPHGGPTAGQEYLQKPFTPMGLARKVRSILDAR